MNSQDIASILTTMLENGTLGSGTGTIIACIIIFWMVKNLLAPLKAKFDEIAKSDNLENVHTQAKMNNEEIIKLNSFESAQFSSIINQLRNIETKLNDLNTQNRNIDDNVKNIQHEIQTVKNNIDNGRIQLLQDQLKMINRNQ